MFPRNVSEIIQNLMKYQQCEIWKYNSVHVIQPQFEQLQPNPVLIAVSPGKQNTLYR